MVRRSRTRLPSCSRTRPRPLARVNSRARKQRWPRSAVLVSPMAQRCQNGRRRCSKSPRRPLPLSPSAVSQSLPPQGIRPPRAARSRSWRRRRNVRRPLKHRGRVQRLNRRVPSQKSSRPASRPISRRTGTRRTRRTHRANRPGPARRTRRTRRTHQTRRRRGPPRTTGTRRKSASDRTTTIADPRGTWRLHSQQPPPPGERRSHPRAAARLSTKETRCRRHARTPSPRAAMCWEC